MPVRSESAPSEVAVEERKTMKRTLTMYLAVVAMASAGLAKDKASQQKPAEQTAQQAPAQTTPGANVKQTKSKEEFAAYNAAVADDPKTAFEQWDLLFNGEFPAYY